MKHVALLIETSRAYGRELLLGVRRYMTEHNPWSVFVELRDLESSPPSWLANWDGDGILARTGSQVMADAVTAVGVPTVELRATKLKHDFPFVGMDNRSIGRLCAHYLAELGYRSFGVYGLASEQFFEERCQSFTEAIQERGYACQSLQQSGNREKPEQWERQQASLVQWLRELPKPTAIMACTDQLGFWLLDACGRANISVPEQVAVIGVENDETLCAMSSPPLSSVSLGGERVGYEAAALLDRLMKGRKPPKKPTLFEPKGIVARRSTDTVAIADPLLSQALRMIREKASSGLRVADILRALPISRSSLERGFRVTLGRSPNEEINRVRLEHARELLIETTLNLEQIADRTGFAQAHYFSHLFAKTYGNTPGKFRKQRRSSFES
jgi:LacI family transcriptional regulator